ncbi:aldehyde reductase [Tothia fuscella]|uniref:Aldehyde reductase n=1 Tax=Tothia fuscella TaxID=1048955 RepID=A0A9P4U1I6_9PEZI|nr:aldehyde reductase [Tothia fuscella]
MSSPLILKDLAIPLGSTVLVTGANGLIGSHIVNQLLAAGYHVRGTVRNVKKNDWMLDFFSKRHGNAKFELIQVEDMEKPGCFDEAVKGVAGVMHTTSTVDMAATDPHPAIGNNIKSVLTALDSSLTEPSVKRFLLTSSAWAASYPKPDVGFHVTADTWNEQAIADAFAKDQPQPNGFAIFIAGKTRAEQEAWKWVRETKPHFQFSTVLPETVFGSVLSPENQGIPTTAGLIKALYNGQGMDFLNMILPQHFIDVVDNAKLHVAALVHPDAANERLLGYAEPFNWNDVLAILREMFPQSEFIDDMELGRDISEVDDGRALELLKLVYGQDEWTGLKDSITANVESFVGKEELGGGGTLASQMS